MSEPKDEAQLRDISHRFSGAIFGDLAFYLVSKSLPQDLVLLSSKRTYGVFADKYPTQGETPPFEEGPLPAHGVHFPDGLAVSDEGDLKAIYEYTLTGRRGYFHAKKDRVSSELDGFPKLVTVVLEDNSHHIEGLEPLPVSANHAEFTSFINSKYVEFERMDGLSKVARDQLGIMSRLTSPVNLRRAIKDALKKRRIDAREYLLVTDLGTVERQELLQAAGGESQVLALVNAILSLSPEALNTLPVIAEGPLVGGYRYDFGRNRRWRLDLKFDEKRVLYTVGRAELKTED